MRRRSKTFDGVSADGLPEELRAFSAAALPHGADVIAAHKEWVAAQVQWMRDNHLPEELIVFDSSQWWDDARRWESEHDAFHQQRVEFAARFELDEWDLFGMCHCGDAPFDPTSI